MRGEDIDAYIVEIEELIRLAEYRFDVPQTIEVFTDGLPTGLYQKILELDRPQTYDQWKQAAINRQQDYIHMKARLKAHRGGTASVPKPRGWMPQQLAHDPNAMDTSAGRTRGRVVGSENTNPTTMRGGYIPRGGFMQRQGGGRQRDLREVECYTCHKKGHLSRNCPQHTWNNRRNDQSSWTPRPSQGREAIVDDRSVVDEEVITACTQTPHQQADAWLRGIATAGVTSQNRSINFSLFYPCLTFSLRLMVTHRLDSCDHLLYRLVTRYVPCLYCCRDFLCHVTYYHMMTDYDSDSIVLVTS